MKKSYLIYTSEENGFEKNVESFNTFDEATTAFKNFVDENIEESDYESETSCEGFDFQGYETYVYIARDASEKKTILSEIAQMRKNFL